ncbi:MAG: hypothetical protein AB7I19_16770 [Planctomycetota bacterium]
MNSNSLLLLSLLGLSSFLSAQDHYLEVWPGTTNFTTRAGGGIGDVHLYQTFPMAHNRGLGDVDGVCAVESIRFTVQDQRGNTPETLYVALRRGSDLTGPGTTNGDYFGGGPFGPIVPPPTATTDPMVWELSVSLGAPVATECEGFLAVGVHLGAAPVWVSDGTSIHMSTAATNLVRPTAPGMAWTYDQLTNTWHRSTDGRTLRIAPGFRDAPILQAGTVGGGTRFGSGGYAPDTTLLNAASLGLALRCFHSAGASVQWIGLANLAGFGSATPTSFLDNSIYVSLAIDPIAFPTFTAADGTPFVLLPAAANALPPASGVTIAIQGIVINNASLELTNAVGVTLN